MKINMFFNGINELDIDFYTGVPDSQLKPFCDHLLINPGINKKHIIATNEGAAVGLAAGHYLATSRPGLIYMQNSGIGNAVNPICSLLNNKVYAIPALFVIGWRGEPDIKDEPQHTFQGEITLELLECLDIKHFIITTQTTEEEFEQFIQELKEIFRQGKQAAFVIKKGALENDVKHSYGNDYPMTREEIANDIIDNSSEYDIFVSTTGKLSRELFEAREFKGQSHKYDFLTVGSMGHSSMIALGIAMEKPSHRVFCLDGDGALLMHTGSLAIVGANGPKNFIHILINNESHETVGGMPTVSKNVDYLQLAESCGYKVVMSVTTKVELEKTLKVISKLEGPIFIEVKANLKSRKDLGRPTTTPLQNKKIFMEFLMSK